MKISSMGLLISLNLLGSLFILSSSSWFSIWMGMELSSMTAPPLILLFNSSLVSKVNSWKYYMVQCYSSAIFFLCALTLSSSSPLSSYSNFFWMVIIASMLLKMGILPFHGWFFHLACSLPWTLFLIFSTIQKIGPMIIIGECSKVSSFFQPDLLMGSIISLISISMLKVNSIRYFLITSSIINTAWMMISTQISKSSFISFMLLYFFHLLILFSFLEKSFNSPLESLFSPSKESFMSELMKMLVILSMIGMPPLVGFFMKMSIISQLVVMNHLATILIILLASSIIMLMYLKIIVGVISKMRTSSLEQYKFFSFLSVSIILFTLSSTYLIV